MDMSHNSFLRIDSEKKVILIFYRFQLFTIAVGCFGVLWSVYSAGTLLCVEELREKRTLLLYPVFLLYVYFFSLYSGV